MPGQAAAREHAATGEGDLARLGPDGAYDARSSAVITPSRASTSASSAAASVPVYAEDAPSSRISLERGDEARLLHHVADGEEVASGRVDLGALAHRHHGLEHREARDVGRRHRDAGPREPKRRLDEPRPRQCAPGAPQRVQPGRHARHGHDDAPIA